MIKKELTAEVKSWWHKKEMKKRFENSMTGVLHKVLCITVHKGKQDWYPFSTKSLPNSTKSKKSVPSVQNSLHNSTGILSIQSFPKQ